MGGPTRRRKGAGDSAWAQDFRDRMIAEAADASGSPSKESQKNQRASIISLMRLASVSITNGLVMTAMPGSRWPLPTTAFSA
ncbi:hypothetical protein SAMN04488125_101385 [Methylorubrum salsuginis]|uniref:Uncharacterized protein n=1 Tax=Methylorubrum salsuginis TaxID=414703 RepID=A0A1I3YXD3_9HYPH|nr:hypothetical protein SAMN04488125_101385 [Methylorubrum salsuginis]